MGGNAYVGPLILQASIGYGDRFDTSENCLNEIQKRAHIGLRVWLLNNE